MMNDAELLRLYAKAGSESAFTGLVRRHLPLVYSAALRQVQGNEALAQDVAQSVFIDLARKASSLASREVLAGWLYCSTRMAASKALRSERRRQLRERRVRAMQESPEVSPPNQNHLDLARVLDEAMNLLGTDDRNAVLLRFFQNQDLKAVGVALGVSEDAARMRVNRALGKLHEFLVMRGITLSATALGALLTTETVSAVPPTLVASISSAALAGTAIKAGAGLTILKAMTLTKAKLALLGALTVAGIAVIQYQVEQVRAQNASLRLKLERVRAARQESERQWSLVSSQPGESPEADLARLRAKSIQLQQQVKNARQRLLAGSLPTSRRSPARGADDSKFPSDVQRVSEQSFRFLRLYPAIFNYATNHPTATFHDPDGQLSPEVTRLTPLLDWDNLEFNIPDSATLIALCATNSEEIIGIARKPLLMDNGCWSRDYLLANGSTLTLWTASPEIYHSRAAMPRLLGEEAK